MMYTKDVTDDLKTTLSRIAELGPDDLTDFLYRVVPAFEAWQKRHDLDPKPIARCIECAAPWNVLELLPSYAEVFHSYTCQCGNDEWVQGADKCIRCGVIVHERDDVAIYDGLACSDCYELWESHGCNNHKTCAESEFCQKFTVAA